MRTMPMARAPTAVEMATIVSCKDASSLCGSVPGAHPADRVARAADAVSSASSGCARSAGAVGPRRAVGRAEPSWLLTSMGLVRIIVLAAVDRDRHQPRGDFALRRP